MQAFQDWVPPGGTLGQILAETRERVRELEAGHGRAPKRSARTRPGTDAPPSLEDALRGATVAVIAEVKRRSPSRGALNLALSAAQQGVSFERGGAAAISVLTEPSRFGGSLDDLHDVAKATRLPLLKKDFHISPVQAREVGDASAILLIARALPPDELCMMVERMRGMVETVVEVRSEPELELALRAGARIIGVNARDLETLEVDETVPERLIPMIPCDVVAVWESGSSTAQDVDRAAAAGADAVLVGSALSLSPNPEALLSRLTTIPRRPRG